MSAAKAKGTEWETRLVRALRRFFGRRYGLHPYRPAQEGYLDVGDLHGLSPFVGQAKAWKNLASGLREGVAGAVVQAARAGEAYGVAFLKKPYGAAGEGYAVLRVEDFARVLLRLRRAEELLAREAPAALAEALELAAADLAEPFPRGTAADD